MTSALQALANSTLVLNVPIAGTTTDDYGNVRPNTSTVTVTAYLRRANPNRSGFGGTDIDGDVMEGYVMAALDSRIVRGTTGTVAFAGEPAQRCEVQDLNYSHGTTGLIGATKLRVLGASIRVIRYQQR